VATHGSTDIAKPKPSRPIRRRDILDFVASIAEALPKPE
jgi:hypothetical protein